MLVDNKEVTCGSNNDDKAKWKVSYQTDANPGNFLITNEHFKEQFLGNYYIPGDRENSWDVMLQKKDDKLNTRFRYMYAPNSKTLQTSLLEDFKR